MSRDALYDRLADSFEREARPEAREALRWVRGGMREPFGPPAIAALARLTATTPLTLTDAHFDEARAAGFDDAALFEIVAAAASGKGLARRDRALAALRKEASP